MSGTNNTKPRGLYAKLAEVMGEVGRVPKRGRNDFHKYDYVREDDLVDAVRDKLSERGVVVLPSRKASHREGTLTEVVVEFTFVDGETGQTHSCTWEGHGDDKGDKGIYKAYTGALKYFLMKSFLIPTGDDPEADSGTDKRAATKGNGKPAQVRRPTASKPRATEAVASPDQRRMIFARSKEHGLEEDQLKAILSAVAGTVHTDRLPKARVDDVLAAIEAAGAPA